MASNKQPTPTTPTAQKKRIPKVESGNPNSQSIKKHIELLNNYKFNMLNETIIGYMANNILPFRIGELYRARRSIGQTKRTTC